MFKFETPVIVLSYSKGVFLAQYDGGSNFLEFLSPALGEKKEIITIDRALNCLYAPADCWVESTYHVECEATSLVLIEVVWTNDAKEGVPDYKSIPNETLDELRTKLSEIPSCFNEEVLGRRSSSDILEYKIKTMKRIVHFLESFRKE